MRRISLSVALAAAALVVALALGSEARARAATQDAGASTFAGAAKRYPRRPIPALTDIPVPRVAPKPANLPSVPDPGPGDAALRFEIKRIDVVGATLLSPSELDEILGPFTGAGKTIADVEKARDALQLAYAEQGFLSVGVAIPQQTIEGGSVLLEVVEARLGGVAVQNDGFRWFSDESVRRKTPHLVPGAVLRQQDLQEDMTRANAHPDRRVRPQIAAGATPGTLDLTLAVDDRIPLHGSIEYNNEHTPGSPETRASATLSYANLWGLEHEASLNYQFVPSAEFESIQIYAATYSAPLPFIGESQNLFAYALKSDSTNAVVTAPGLLALGKGVSAGFRYRSGLPAFRDAGWYEHSLSFGADRKDVENAVVADEASVVTPITYMPFTLEYSGFVARPQFFTSFRLGPSFNFAGMLPGGSKNDFRNNRGGLVDPISDVTGTFQIFRFGLQHTMRLPGLLQTLGQGRFVAPPEPTGGFDEDWTLQLSSRGQFASQPLISTEQFAAGGTDSVRGYLQGERFGDDGWNLQFELRTPYFESFLGGLLQERAQLLVFYDSAALWTQNPGEGQDPMTMLQGIGLGLRAGIFQHVNAYAYIAYPREKTEFTEGFRYHFGISAGF